MLVLHVGEHELKLKKTKKHSVPGIRDAEEYCLLPINGLDVRLLFICFVFSIFYNCLILNVQLSEQLHFNDYIEIIRAQYNPLQQT